MKIMILGDTHGNERHTVHLLNEAGKRNIQHVLQVGDFGLWTHQADGHEFLDTVNAAAEGNKLSVYAIGGNHENWDHWNWFVENMPTHKGFAMVRRRVLISPKVNKWTWDNKQFVVAGGGVSIDKAQRLLWEREKGKSRIYYWPNEELTDEDVNTIRGWEGLHVDYLLTHDCSNYTPWKHRLKNDLQSQIHRQRIDEVIRITKPGTHFHGHMHEQYDWLNAASHRHQWTTQTYGLEMDGMWFSWGILDTETNKFSWRGESISD